ncbi:hypothetical protein C8R44DRAFT_921389 [Mycena epipterygia]|nr:hypothetical protein C8R44DRAFT_921389 [Mycena epipterygia]
MHICVALLLLSTSIYAIRGFPDVSTPAPTGSDVVIQANSFSISAAGVGADGATTYVEVEVESSHLQVEPSRTITFLSVPTTFTNTFIADASGVRLSYATPVPFQLSSLTRTVAETCSFGANGLGTCVLDNALAGSATASTFSGSVVPLYTLAAATTAPTTTQPSSSTSPNGAAPHHVFAHWNVVWMVLGILFHIL